MNSAPFAAWRHASVATERARITCRRFSFSAQIRRAAMVRSIVLDCFAEQEAVLADPAPSAFIDSIVDGRILFNCFAHVASPRAAYGTRSAVLLQLLPALRERGITIGTVPQRLELVGQLAPPAPDEREMK